MLSLDMISSHVCYLDGRVREAIFLFFLFLFSILFSTLPKKKIGTAFKAYVLAFARVYERAVFTQKMQL